VRCAAPFPLAQHIPAQPMWQSFTGHYTRWQGVGYIVAGVWVAAWVVVRWKRNSSHTQGVCRVFYHTPSARSSAPPSVTDMTGMCTPSYDEVCSAHRDQLDAPRTQPLSEQKLMAES
jgi:hypothetical protein